MNVIGQVIFFGQYGMSDYVVKAQALASGTPHARWILQFERYSHNGRKQLNRVAHWTAWTITKGGVNYRQWDPFRWNPVDDRLIPKIILQRVESWLYTNPANALRAIP